MATSGINYINYFDFPNTQMIVLKSIINLYHKGKLIAKYTKLNNTLTRYDELGDHIKVISHFKRWVTK